MNIEGGNPEEEIEEMNTDGEDGVCTFLFFNLIVIFRFLFTFLSSPWS
jgi:hypothetical protein